MNVKYYNYLAQRMLDEQNNRGDLYYELPDGRLMKSDEYDKYLDAVIPDNPAEAWAWALEQIRQGRPKKEPIND